MDTRLLCALIDGWWSACGFFFPPSLYMSCKQCLGIGRVPRKSLCPHLKKNKKTATVYFPATWQCNDLPAQVCIVLYIKYRWVQHMSEAPWVLLYLLQLITTMGQNWPLSFWTSENTAQLVLGALIKTHCRAFSGKIAWLRQRKATLSQVRWSLTASGMRTQPWRLSNIPRARPQLAGKSLFTRVIKVRNWPVCSVSNLGWNLFNIIRSFRRQAIF